MHNLVLPGHWVVVQEHDQHVQDEHAEVRVPKVQLTQRRVLVVLRLDLLNLVVLFNRGS